jgi:hypothetical protein
VATTGLTDCRGTVDWLMGIYTCKGWLKAERSMLHLFREFCSDGFACFLIGKPEGGVRNGGILRIDGISDYLPCCSPKFWEQ